MQNKIKILSISKSESRSEFSFPKEQKFFEIIRNFLIKLGFEKGDSMYNGSILAIGRPIDEDDRPIVDKEDNIKKYRGFSRNYSNKDYSVDVIYFKDKIVLIVNYKKDKQQIVSEALGNFVLENNKK
jgi:hypothetical protein